MLTLGDEVEDWDFLLFAMIIMKLYFLTVLEKEIEDDDEEEEEMP